MEEFRLFNLNKFNFIFLKFVFLIIEKKVKSKCDKNVSRFNFFWNLFSC